MSNKKAIQISEKKMPTIQETWVDIKGYEGIYQVSDLGNVRSIDRLNYNKGNNSYHKTKGVIRKKVTHKNGYDQVMLANNGLKLFLVHRLVANAFIENPSNKDEVNHINGIKTDNRAVNLEWCTRKENEIHAHNTGLKKQGREVINIETGIIYSSIKEAAESHGIKRTTLNRFLTGRTANKTNLRYI